MALISIGGHLWQVVAHTRGGRSWRFDRSRTVRLYCNSQLSVIFYATVYLFGKF